MPKRPCTNRAAWRLVRGQSPRRLSAHYQLECDYGTAFTAIYKDGDAFFLCDAHATSFNAMDAGTIAGVRVIKSPSPGAQQAKIDLFTKDSETAANSPKVFTSPVAAATIMFDDAPLATVSEPNQNAEPTDAEPNHSDKPDPEIQASDKAECSAPLKVIEEREPAAAEPNVTSFPESAAICAVETLRRETVRSTAKKLIRDLTFGDCAKALVDEAIWNMLPGDYEAYKSALQQGKSAVDAAQVAGGQLAILHRRINEATIKIETLLAESKSAIDVRHVVDGLLEQVTLEIIDNRRLNEKEKDSVIAQLGTFQEWISHELGTQCSPLLAHRLMRSIGERANWGVGSCATEELKPAYRVIYTALRDAVLSEVPTALNLDEHLANLCAARCDLEVGLNHKILHSAM